MGAWGSGHFENDDAADLIRDLVDAGSWSVAEATFDDVLAVGDDYLEAPESSAAIGAAAVIAHRLGNLAVDIIPEHAAAVSALPTPSPVLISKARAALARIKQQSELGDLWGEGNARAEWLATVDDIERAL